MVNSTLKSTLGSIGKLRRVRQSREGNGAMARYKQRRLLSERLLPDKDESKHFPGRKHEVTQQ
jgi:hypothetical protein